ncbi:sensor domain-containing diguanylate cyclase [Achromobacter aloeverae]|nr:diguanylate cyclase [Achromobacter aloeverae]
MSRIRSLLSSAVAPIVRVAGNRPCAVGIAGTVVALAAALVPLSMMWLMRHQVIDHQRETSENLNAMIALDLENNFRFYDVQLQDLVSDEQALAAHGQAVLADTDRAGIFKSLPLESYVDTKFVVNAMGVIVAAQQKGKDNIGMSVDDRRYFIEQKNKPDIGLYISHPFTTRAKEGGHVMALSRRINAADGSFAGIAFFEVRLEFFQRLFERIQLDAPGVVEILLDDGTMVASKPYSDVVVGSSVAASPIYKRLADKGRGTLIARGRDGIERLYTFRRVAGLPFFAVVAPTMDDVLEDWKRHFRLAAAASVFWGIALTVGAWLLALALRQKLRVQAELARLAATDPLTKLHNRRTFDARFDAEWKHAMRRQRPISALFIDIDRFKLYNDTYGHAEGDKVLASVAQCIGATVRRSVDVVARYGGEEFVVLLPDTEEAGAARVAEEVRRNVRGLDIENTGSQIGRVTVSIGCASCVPAAGELKDALLAAADALLYKAKASGRDQVRSAPLAPAATEAVAPR